MTLVRSLQGIFLTQLTDVRVSLWLSLFPRLSSVRIQTEIKSLNQVTDNGYIPMLRFG